VGDCKCNCLFFILCFINIKHVCVWRVESLHLQQWRLSLPLPAEFPRWTHVRLSWRHIRRRVQPSRTPLGPGTHSIWLIMLLDCCGLLDVRNTGTGDVSYSYIKKRNGKTFIYGLVDISMITLNNMALISDYCPVNHCSTLLKMVLNND